MNKQNYYKRVIFNTILISIVGFSIVTTGYIAAAPSESYFFRVSILCRSDNESLSIANLLQQELRRISIDSTIVSEPEGAFEAAVVSRDFDIVLIDIEWPNKDVDPTYIFSEGGSSNYWGINSVIKGSELNEEYLASARIASNLTTRIEIYHDWQQNLMDEILPVIPLYNEITTFVSWNSLSGWDHEEGIIASLPYMEWTSAHTGQTNTSVFNDYAVEWDILNPLFVEDDFFSSFIHEPLLRINSFGNAEPVLAESWEFNSNKTILSITLRDNILWQTDRDEIYVNEPFSTEDVDFSIRMYQNVSTTGTYFKWIKDIEIMNSTFLNIYIDGNETEAGLQPYAPALYELDELIIPEHYLNVSVGVNGLPNTNHENWNDFAEFGLGTGMYYLDSYSEGVESIFNKNDDWWGTRADAFNDDLDIAKYVIRFLGTSIENNLIEFQSGNLDIYRDYREYMTYFDSSPYQKQSRYSYDVVYFGFNLQSTNTPELADQTLCEDETMTRSLALRKAIAHMIDKEVVGGLLNIGINVIESPLSAKFGSYVYNDIIKYDADLEKAKGFMIKAGYNPATNTPGFTFICGIITTITLSFILRFKKRRNK